MFKITLTTINDFGFVTDRNELSGLEHLGECIGNKHDTFKYMKGELPVRSKTSFAFNKFGSLGLEQTSSIWTRITYWVKRMGKFRTISWNYGTQTNNAIRQQAR